MAGIDRQAGLERRHGLVQPRLFVEYAALVVVQAGGVAQGEAGVAGRQGLGVAAEAAQDVAAHGVGGGQARR